MKLLKNIIAFLVILVLSAGCEEIPPEIIPCQTNRVILVEEFTGIKCVNCPIGAEKLEQLSKQNPGKIVVVGIHAGFFANDYNGFDLKCRDGQDLEQYLGPVQAYPAAAINRKIYEDENQLPLELAKWAGLIGNEICQPPIVELAVSTTYDNTDRKASVVVDVTRGQFYNELLREDLALTVMVTEDNITGYQLTPDGGDNSYKHKHVLRDVLSNDFKGDVIIGAGNPISAQQVVISDYQVPADWNAENCHIVAFVHDKGLSSEVHQAIEVSLQP